MDKKMLEDYLAGLPREQASICRRLHEKVLRNMHGTVAMIYHNALGYATSLKPSHRIVYIAPQKGYVNLGFFFGADIPDLEKLLVGNGKRMRHIKIKTEQDLDKDAIDDILKAGWDNAQINLAHIRDKSI